MTNPPDDTSASSTSTWNVVCTDCKGLMKLKLTTRTLHADKSCKRFYWCEQCKASIQADQTGKPIAKQADQKTRRERHLAHMDIDCYMLITGMTKDAVYKRMAYLMRMNRADFHLGCFDYVTCVRLRVNLIRDLLKLTLPNGSAGS